MLSEATGLTANREEEIVAASCFLQVRAPAVKLSSISEDKVKLLLEALNLLPRRWAIDLCQKVLQSSEIINIPSEVNGTPHISQKIDESKIAHEDLQVVISMNIGCLRMPLQDYLDIRNGFELHFPFIERVEVELCSGQFPVAKALLGVDLNGLKLEIIETYSSTDVKSRKLPPKPHEVINENQMEE